MNDNLTGGDSPSPAAGEEPVTRDESRGPPADAWAAVAASQGRLLRRMTLPKAVR